MQIYIEYSTRISEIALKYVHPEDFHQYSIDEFFMEIIDSYHLFSSTPRAFAKCLKAEIYDATRIHCAIGIGENLLYIVHRLRKVRWLLRDYKFNELYVILLEHVDEVTYRVRQAKQLARTISFSIGTKDGKIYRKQLTINPGTNNSNILIEMIWNYLKTVVDPYGLYRTVNISLTHFILDSVMQLSLFETDANLKEEKLYDTIDTIKRRVR